MTTIIVYDWSDKHLSHLFKKTCEVVEKYIGYKHNLERREVYWEGVLRIKFILHDERFMEKTAGIRPAIYLSSGEFEREILEKLEKKNGK